MKNPMHKSADGTEISDVSGGPDDATPRFESYDETRDGGTNEERGLGSAAAGQSGDLTGLSRDEIEGPESVEELVEEGQSYEASVISGIENAPDADQGPVRTHQVPEDDVPQEYLDEQ